jgi:hypothetical protein
MSTVSELRILAKTLGVKGYSVAKKGDLITLIEKHQEAQALPPGKPSTQAPKVPEVIKVQAEAPKEEVKDQASKPKRSNDWNNYLADYRKEHGGTLRAAMAGAKESYAKHKESKKAEAPAEEKRPFRDLP